MSVVVAAMRVRNSGLLLLWVVDWQLAHILKLWRHAMPMILHAGMLVTAASGL